MTARGGGARDEVIDSAGHRLWAHTARPAIRNGSGRRGLVLAHGFPTGMKWAESSGRTYPEFADRLTVEAGWTVLAFNFRGIGRSDGDFSIRGWLDDLHAAIAHLRDSGDVDGVWLAGFRTGGALAICAAADDAGVRGVATFGAPADFDGWAADPRRALDDARRLGVIRHDAYPDDVAAWAQEFKETRALDVVERIPPRPLMIVHGSIDDTVPLSDARVLADSAADADLRVITGAGHRLRHDPRAVALLIGWLDRQTL
ncbi:MAG TPA: alpha/beta fold hydrolase [Acidimicrobiales bacterium]|nr:alpha/beta fold hydrolase [Acidimicrobiales bacterium]